MGNCQNISSGNDPTKAQKVKKNNSNNLTIKTYTWNRDSHGLFDYESKDIMKNQLKLPEPGLVIREKEEIKIISMANFKGDQPDLKKLIGVDIRDYHYVLDSECIINAQSVDENDPQKKPVQEEGIGELSVWAVVKSLKTSKGTKGYELQVGDYLKLGRVRFRIKELQGIDQDKKGPIISKNFYFGSNVNVLNMDEMAPIISDKDSVIEKQDNACRICLGDADEEDNPFITPCKCDGTMKCIHVKCLQQWLKSRLHPKETPFSISFVWKNFDCELCKSQFPNMVKVKGQVYDTVEIPRPSAPYITLEILSKDKNICKGIHVITLSQKNQIKLGRGHDSDIRISDISVSRCHAVLSYDAGVFTIEDNNSKFGTLALIKDPIKLTNENNNIAIQVGRTVLSFGLKKNWKIYQVPIPQVSQNSNVSEKTNAPPQQDKKGPKIKMIEAPGQKDIENVMNQNQDDIEEGQSARNPHLGENGNGINPEIKKQGGKNDSNNVSGGDGQYDQKMNSVPMTNNFQLPEFKDPAEELEAFQLQKEKESEIQTLEQQLVLLTQHKNLNQSNLEHMAASNGDPKMEADHATLQHRVEQYSQKIKEIQLQIQKLKDSSNNKNQNIQGQKQREKSL